MRAPKWGKDGLKRGEWSPEEDEKLKEYIRKYGIWNWGLMPRFAGLSRSGKSCRLRWMNYLRPDLKRGNITDEEEKIIISMHEKLGNRWSAIAATLPGRTDNEIKNYWHTHLKKRVNSREPVVKKRSNPNSEAITNPEAPSSANDQNSPFLSTPTDDSNNIYLIDEETSIDSWESFEDLQILWSLPESDVDIRYNFMDSGNDPNFQQEPTNPYGFNNYEYWLDHLFQDDWYQMQ